MDNSSEEWKICCSKSSSHFIKFFITFSICFIVLIFSMMQIINMPEKDNSIYFSLISSILALYMDSPKLEPAKIQKNNVIVENHKENTDNV